jgi:hypothetical protein
MLSGVPANATEDIMRTRRSFIAATAVAASSLASLRSALAQGGRGTPEEAEFLFVQSAD